jgi:DNA-binding transcriptional ArsR family regulator
MGELVAGKPALQLNFLVSLPLDLVSVLSLLYRAVPGSGLDPWLVRTRRSLPGPVQDDLDLLHGFSGRLLYYMEEPVMRFGPLRPEHLNADFDDLMTFLTALPAVEFRAMAANALRRVHRDLGSDLEPPKGEDVDGWRRYLQPGLTTAGTDETIALIQDPDELKARTLGLYRDSWECWYRDDNVERQPELKEAARVARSTEGRGFGLAFGDLTGNRMPAPLASGLNDVACVTFCPSYHLGTFVSYIHYPPDLIVFFGAPELLARQAPRTTPGGQVAEVSGVAAAEATKHGLSPKALLESLSALADGNRLRILDLLGGGELYAQELVGRLGIAQSAVSRHLSLLERAGLVTVRPRGGMKYYAVDAGRLHAVADALRARGRP